VLVDRGQQGHQGYQMKKIRKHITVVSVIVLIIVAASDGIETKTEATGSDKGLVFSTPQNEGIFTIYMMAVFKELGHRLGMPCTMIELPKKRCLTDSNKGRYDGVAARIMGLEAMGYRNLIRINVSHYTVQHIFYARAGEMTDDVQDLVSLMDAAKRRNFLIGYLQGSKKAEQLLADLPAVNKIALDLPEQAFRMLSNGRISAYLAGPGIVNRAALKNLKNSARNNDRMQAIEELFIASESELFPYLHVKHEKLIPVFEAALRSMKADGTLDKLYQSVL
jgi:polar amino acid transport system substrate-binding protein